MSLRGLTHWPQLTASGAQINQPSVSTSHTCASLHTSWVQQSHTWVEVWRRTAGSEKPNTTFRQCLKIGKFSSLQNTGIHILVITQKKKAALVKEEECNAGWRGGSARKNQIGKGTPIRAWKVCNHSEMIQIPKLSFSSINTAHLYQSVSLKTQTVSLYPPHQAAGGLDELRPWQGDVCALQCKSMKAYKKTCHGCFTCDL